MFFKRYYLGCLSHASYMIADEETKIAAVIDPQRDVDQYLADADRHGFDIRYVFLTHFHADFVAGHIELRDRAGAKIYLGARAEAEYEFTPVKEGDVVEFGRVRLAILETPGHTPEGISILVYDLQEGFLKPHAVLTGDTLFIGDVGRPDLLASVGVTADELGEMLYDSLHNKLLALPDETLVYPAHGAGSMCGKNLSDKEYSTIGEQRRYNYALQPMGKEAFLKLVTAEQPEAPEYFLHDAVLNRQERASLDQSMRDALAPMDVDAVLARQAEGATLLDTRDGVEFAGSHLRGSINIPLDGKYATWCGTVLDKAAPIVVIADEGREEESVMRLGRIGFDRVLGRLERGIEALQDRPELLESTTRITARAVAERLGEPEPPEILDVRTEQEWSRGHIEGSRNLPLNQLAARAAELPSSRPLVVHCQSGYRSTIAVSLLQKLGRNDVLDLVGGYAAWTTSGLPATAGEPATGEAASGAACGGSSCTLSK